MGQKLICDRCNEEKITSPNITPVMVPAAGSPPTPRWLVMRISLSPMYINQMVIDICPTCCESLNLPTDGRPTPQNDRSALEDIVRDIATEIVEDYQHD